MVKIVNKISVFIIILVSIIFVGNVKALSGFNVENIEVNSKSSTIDVENPSITDNTVTSNIKFNQKEDYVTFNLTIKNNYNEPYSIQNITDNNSNNKFSISYNYPTDFIQPNETTNVQITFKYNDTVKNVDTIDISDLTITLSLVNEEGETKGDDIINPTTKDSILKYILWLIIAFIGIVLSLVFIKNDKAKGIVALLCLSVLIIPIVIRANEEIEFSVKFTNIELVGEYETYEIQIKDKDGNVVETRSIKYGEKIGTLSHADVTGYDFDKYVDQNGNEVTEDTIITGPISVLLKYTANTYQVSFNKNNEYAEGSMSNQTFTYDVEQALTNNAFTYTGYHFVEWNTNAAGTGNSYTDGQAIKNLLTEGSVELFAIWTENTDTPYVVYHYQQQTNGSYLESDKDELTGTTGAVITPSVKNYEGFTAPSTTTTTISRFGNTEITYEYLRNQYNLTIVHPEYVEADKSGTYYYGEQVTLNAKTRAGYTFDGWSNGATTQETTITIGTSNISVEPLYTANTDTPYLVVHKYETLNGDYVTETATETGTTDTTVSAPVIPRTGFKTPSLQQVTINGNGQSRVEYVYDREEYTFEVTDRTYLTSASTANGTYKYGYTISLEAQARDGYTFKWSDDDTSYTKTFDISSNTTLSLIYTYNKYHITFNSGVGTCSEASRDIARGTAIGTLPTCNHPQGRQFLGWTYNDTLIDDNYTPAGDIELTASYQTGDYTITFDANGGDPVNPISVIPGQSVNSLPTPTRTSKVFEGWYTNLTDGIKVEVPYTPEGNITLVAKWADYLCVKATSLDGATCGHTDGNKGCRKAYSQGTPYEYGNIIDSDTLESGDAFDCNVDGTGYNQRFYYLRTIDDKAALISYTNYEGETGQGNTQSYVYSTALTKLPTTTQWNNLPITFEVAEDNTRAARLMTYTDLIYACGNGSSVTNANLLNCQYIFENSGFESTTTGRNGTWIAEENGTYRRIHNSNVAFETKTASSENTVKPVIEVPLKYINDQYIVKFDANGGTLTGDEYVRVNKGSSLGTLPQTSNGNYIFDGWYTSLNYDTEVDSSTVPNGYNTYYAKWTKSVDDAELNKDNFIIELGSSDRIIINNSDEIEDHEFVSNDDTIASVDSDGVIMALSEGNTTISINGLNTQVTISVTVTVIPVSTDYTVSFDPVGGSAVDDMHVTKDTALGSLPEEPIKAGFTFGGWYTYTDYATKVTADTIIDGNVTFYAKWIPEGKVAEINNTFYDSIQEAANAATSSKTTIIVLQDVSQNDIILDLFSKNTNKNIVLDLDGHTITCTGTQAIKTKATLEITNGTVIDTSSNGTIDLGAGGHLIMNDGRVENSGSRAAIYNDGGTVEIGGTTYLTSNAYYEATKHRGTVQNVSGTTIITGGTIINTRSANSYAVSGNGGTLIIGNENDVYDKDAILMQGETSGIYSDVEYSMFDGTAKGKTSGVHDTAKITEIEDGAVPVTDTDGDFTLYYYEINNPYYVINLEPNGGTVSPNTLHVDKGQEIGNQLPTPTRGVYTFDGWYTNLTDGILVDEHTIPQGNETYVAKWHYEASTEIDNFNMTNDVMTAYYNSIGTWKNDQSTFQANMDANFNYYGCKCNENTCSTSGTNLCDKPNGYDTGFTGQINVYDSSEANKEKGNPVTYTTSDNGVIYNMIPGQTYYWELDSDPQVHGLVKAEGNRRTLNINGVRNARDLGGLKVDTDGDGTVDGTLKYGIIFRGERLYSDTNNVTQLAKLGINEEIDLRKSSEIPTTEAQFPTDQFKHREIKHYQIDYQTQYDNYKLSRDLVIEVMKDIIAGKKVYFHCRIGTDRTGTLAYILEGLLGVTEEEMLEDYELSYFFGLVNRHRYYATDPNSSVSKDQKFVYMYNSINDDGGVYSWFVQDCQTQQERQDLDDLIQAFRDYMIE